MANSFNELQNDISLRVWAIIQEEMMQVTTSSLGLDERSYNGRGPWISNEACQTGENYLIVETSETQDLNYYGGFQYVDASAVRVFGDYTVYDGDLDERVMGHIDTARGHFAEMGQDDDA